jgi:DNA-binding GntR family transcriptional regulator
MMKKESSADRFDGENAVDFVAEQIREGIFSGRYAIGQRMVEIDLTREYSVSRNTLRAALTKLAGEGLIEQNSNRGATIARLTRKAVKDTFELRATLDGYIARESAKNIGQDDNRARLTAALKIWEGPEVLADAAIHLRENAAFHDLLSELSGNQRVYTLLRQLQIPGYRLRFRLLLTAVPLARSTADHLAVGKAILAGDQARAEALARAHTEWSSGLLQSLPDSDFSI